MFEMEAPYDVMGAFVGKQGYSINELQEKAGRGCYIQVNPPKVAGGPQLVQVRGATEAAANGFALVKARIAELTEDRMKHAQWRAASKKSLAQAAAAAVEASLGVSGKTTQASPTSAVPALPTLPAVPAEHTRISTPAPMLDSGKAEGYLPLAFRRSQGGTAAQMPRFPTMGQSAKPHMTPGFMPACSSGMHFGSIQPSVIAPTMIAAASAPSSGVSSLNRAPAKNLANGSDNATIRAGAGRDFAGSAWQSPGSHQGLKPEQLQMF